MPKGPRGEKRPRDPNQLAKMIVDIATGEEPDTSPKPKNEAAVAHGREGGKKRAESMSPKRRKETARKAAQKRWKAKEPT